MVRLKRKRCSKCSKLRAISLFHANKNKKDGHEKSCKDCYNKRKRHLKHLPNRRYIDYKSKAKRLNMVFDITLEQFSSITSRHCSYCGAFSGKFQGKGFTGIDRINTNQGYHANNCVPCCSDCNYMKWTKDVPSFLGHIKKISKFQAMINGQ